MTKRERRLLKKIIKLNEKLYDPIELGIRLEEMLEDL